MNVRQRAILHALETGSRTAAELAGLFTPPAPEPSIRRTIQTLRDRGHRISFATDSAFLVYRLVPALEDHSYDPTFDTDVDPGDEA